MLSACSFNPIHPRGLFQPPPPPPPPCLCRAYIYNRWAVNSKDFSFLHISIKNHFFTNMVQDVSMATIWKVRFYSNQYFAQKRPVKMIFWTIPLLSIPFCLFRTSPNSLTLFELIFRQFWALWKLLFLAAFRDHLTSLTSGAYCWGLTFFHIHTWFCT